MAGVDHAPATLRNCLRTAVRTLLAEAAFDAALSGYLPAAEASQMRLPKLRAKLRGIAGVEVAVLV